MLLPLLLLAQAATTPMAPDMPMPEPVCVRAGDLPPAFAKWNAAPSPTLEVGTPYIATGRDPLAIKPATGATSGHAGKAATATFLVVKAGIYSIGLSTGAWIDLVAKGKALTSVAHGHGPICTGLRKMVDFRLAPGSYTVQLAGMKADTTKVMIVRK